MGLNKQVFGWALALLASTSFAQNLSTFVNSRPVTDAQRNTGNAVQAACSNLGTIFTNGGSVPLADPNQEDLRNECNRMVRTARALQGGAPGSTNLGADATDATLAEALSRIAPEELASASKTSIEAASRGATNAIRGRLSALRGGARGLAMNGDEHRPQGLSYAASEVFGKPQRGGAAGADDAGPLGGKLGAFVNASINKGDKDTTDREDGFDFDNWSLLGGVDYRFTDNVVAGVALGYNQTNVDFERSLGSIETNAWGIAAYTTVSFGKFYVEGQASYFKNDYDSTRNITYPTNAGQLPNREAKGSANGDQFSLSAGGGYDFNFGGLSVAPYGRLEFIDLSIDAIDESGAQGLNLHVDGQDARSLQSALGGRVAYAISTGFGVLVPQASLEWIHEFDNDSRNVSARYINDPQNNIFFIPTESPDRNYFRLNLGVSAVFQHGFSAFANYETVQGLKDISHNSLLFGVRKEW